MKITERGWQFHMKSRVCRFHRNTLIQHGNTSLVVSTIGDFWSPNKVTFGPHPLGCDFIGDFYKESYIFKENGDLIVIDCEPLRFRSYEPHDDDGDDMHQESIERAIAYLETKVYRD